MTASKSTRKPKIGDTRTLAGGRKAEYVLGTDAHGQSSEHFRTVDTIGLLLKRGRIDVPAYDAGRRFAEDFEAAHMGGLRARDYGSIGGSSSASQSSTERGAYAKQRLWKALNAVGGVNSLGGRLLWNMVGLEVSCRQWAQQEALCDKEAKDMIIITLEILAQHYGYTG